MAATAMASDFSILTTTIPLWTNLRTLLRPPLENGLVSNCRLNPPLEANDAPVEVEVEVEVKVDDVVKQWPS